MTKPIYMNNAIADVSAFHPVIMEAIANGGVFGDDYADIFKLTKTTKGSAVQWVLDFA